MNRRTKVIISVIFAMIGFMVAILFQSTNNQSDVRDTRDLWEVRSELQKQQKTQQKLYKKIEDHDRILMKYVSQSEREKVNALKASIQKLKEKAGLTEVTGDGVIITVEPIFMNINSGQAYPSVSSELLYRLVNELNSYGATDIAISDERITNISPIRDVNGYTYVNNHPVPPLPIEIRILSDNPKRLLNYIQVSQSKDDFSIENLQFKVELKNDLTLPKYEQTPNLKMLQVLDKKETGES